MATIEVSRPALCCAVCGDELARDAMKCSHDPSHEGVEMSDEGCFIEVKCSAWFSAYVPARTWGDPGDCYPAEGGECEEFESTVDGKEFSLTDDEEKDAIEACWKEAEKDDGGYDGPEPDDYYDYY